MQQVPKVRLVGVVVGLLALAALWYVRPIWHGLALVLWTAPIVWVPPLLLLAAGAVTLRRSRRSWSTLEELQAGGRVPAGIVAFPVLAFLSLVVLGGLNGPLVQRAIVTNTTYEDIPNLPAGGKVRLVPRDVAETNASSGFNSSTETLTDFRIINTPQGLTWTALRTPNGAFRIFTKKSEGLVRLDAESTSRSVEQVDAQFETAPALQLTDNLRWRLLKERFLVRLEDPVAVPTPRGPRILVPYTEHKGFPIRRPVPGGVFVVAPDGTIEDLEPQEAARRPELAITGRIIADTQARRFHDAYAYKGGLWNAWFVHEDQTQITDTELNRQPYLIDFGGQLGTQWVTVAEPYGRAFAASAIFLTDTDTGQTRIWRVPRGRSLSGNRRALDAVRSSAIPGIDFTNFRVVEPRPVFVNGRLLYVVSIIPARGNAVSKTVVVDAETNRFVARFDNDSDPQAEEKTLAFLETGRLPDGTRPGAGAGAAAGGTGATGATGSTGTTGATGAGGARDVRQRIDDLIERQRQTLRELEELQRQVRSGDGP
jgi:hypothetical protein